MAELFKSGYDVATVDLFRIAEIKLHKSGCPHSKSKSLMSRCLSREELERKVRELEDKLAAYENSGSPEVGENHGILRESDLTLTRAALSRAALGVFWISPEGRFVYANDTAFRMLGYSRQEMLKMHVSDVDDNHPERIRGERWKLYKEKKAVSFETRHRTKDGRYFPVLVDANYLKVNNHEYEIAYARDISELKKAKNELQESRDSQQILLDNIPA